MELESLDTFFDKLKVMRGIAELDKHLLHALFRMQPDISERTQKFLCLCFSLWDDGNTRVPLDIGIFTARWQKKWNGLLLLRESADDCSIPEMEDFGPIIEAGIQDLCKKDFSKILSVQNTCEPDSGEISTPLILTKEAGECPYLYLDKLFKAKLLIYIHRP